MRTRPLLRLPPYRVATEMRRVAQADQDECDERRDRRSLVLQWIAGYAVGVFLMGMGFHTADEAAAPVYLQLGQIVCALSSVITVFRFWRREG